MSEYIVERVYDQTTGLDHFGRREEIVRCRDCMNYEYREHLGRSYCCGEYPTEPDGFCKWACRKDGGDSE